MLIRVFNLIRPVILLCAGLFSSHLGFSQDLKIADSLLIKLNNESEIPDSIMYQWLLDISFNHSDIKIKLKYANQLQTLARQNGNNLWLYKGLYIEGVAQRLLGDLPSAINTFFECAKLAEVLGGKKRLGEVYDKLGNVYSVQGDHSNSVKYYNKAIVILREESDSLSLAAALMNAGDEYFNADKLDSALLLFAESGIIFKNVNYQIGNAYNLGNIGLVYAKQDKHNLAEANLFEASKILEESGDKYPVAVYDTYMADIYLQKGDLKRALYYATKSYDVSIELGLKEQIRDASLKLSELYQQNEDF
ncbi:MAG: tetratricopeptide repeat protein, partial [Bacteroidota bacterium]